MLKSLYGCLCSEFSVLWLLIFFFQAEDGIRDAQESRGLGDVYKRQELYDGAGREFEHLAHREHAGAELHGHFDLHVQDLSLIHI